MRAPDGLSVVITGASSGIGAAIARDLAKHGARLMLAARREDHLKALLKEIDQPSGSVRYRVVDVARRDEVHALVEAAVCAFGRVDVLVNCDAPAGLRDWEV